MLDSTLQGLLYSAAETDKGIHEITGSKDIFVSYAELLKTSLSVLHIIQDSGAESRDEVILYVEDSSRFLHTFWACILGNMIPIPLTASSNPEHLSKLNNVCEVLKKPYIITDIPQQLNNTLDHTIEIITYDQTITIEKEGIVSPSDSSQIAFIQFSSGSTGNPKGVTLTHQNLLTNIQAIVNGMQFKSTERSLNWMPFTHDMGLIGGHLTPLAACSDQFQMPTSLFVRRPVLWIKKAAEHRINYLSSPNFGYGYFLDYVKDSDLQDVDLTCVKLIFNGAEPISAELCEQFAQRLAPYGLSSHVWFPVYGMAEASLAVAFPRIGDGLRKVYLDRRKLGKGDCVQFSSPSDWYSTVFVDEGYPVQDCLVKICGENGESLPEQTVGQIYISGNNVTKGYYNNDLATKEALSEDSWLKTGDLGFLYEGRLIVTGREKDIIFIHGQNVYPHDIERLLEQNEGIKPGRVAVCGARNETSGEDLLLFWYTPKIDYDTLLPLFSRLKQVVREATGITVKEVIPIRRIPKTTSGKVQRYQLATRYEEGEFDSLVERIREETKLRQELKASRLPQTETEIKLVHLLNETISDPTIEVYVTTEFDLLGLNSLKVSYFAARISEQFHIHMHVSVFIDSNTIEKLAVVVDHECHTSSKKNVYEDQQDHWSPGELIPAPLHLQRLYVMDQMSEVQTANHITLVLKSSLYRSLEDWNKALSEVAQLHDALRMFFVVQNNELFIDFKAESTCAFERIFVENGSVEASIINWLKPFDLKNPPLWRAGLIELEEQQQLVFDFHHTVIDGSSATIFVQDLFSRISNKEVIQPSIKYADVCTQFHENLNSGELDESRAYWIKQFENGIPILELPTDKTRPLQKTYKGASIQLEINEQLTSELKAISVKERSTIYIILLSAYYQLLASYTGQDDIVIGTPFANRAHPRWNQTIGMLINTLPIRLHSTQEQTFAELLSSVKTRVFDALDHQSYFCENLISELNIPPVTDRNLLYDVVFIMQNFIGLSDNENEQIDWVELSHNSSKVDLSLECVELKGTLQLTLEYSTDLFTENTIQRLANHYLQILKSVVKNEQIKLSNIEILTNEEKNLLIQFSNAVNSNDDNSPENIPFITQFMERVNQHPEAIALQYHEQAMTYKELDEVSNRLANELVNKGIQREMIVGVMTYNGIGQVVALLAIWKAGGACMPIDPEYPIERIRYMVYDCLPKVIISDHSLIDEMLPGFEHIDLSVCLQLGDSTITSNPLTLIESQDLALMMYTSGTTGKPKGVMVEQRNLSTYIRAFQNEFNIIPQDVVLQQSSFAFDNYVEEVLPTLAAGASLLVMDKEELLNISLLEQYLKEYNVSVISCSCLYLNELNKMDIASSVRLMIGGGDVLKPEYVSNLLDQCDVYNTYGPTETTVCASYYRCEAGRERYPIGKPIDGYRIYIVDSHFREVPIGIAGQICIAGSGVTRGYYGKEELTNDRFGEHFISGERVYLTGDYGRWMADGNIEFLGRKDRQIKIRGHRVELDEAEQAVAWCNGVKDVKIVADQEKGGASVLIAYVITDQPISAQGLREQLIQKVPEYMIPSHFIEIDSFPTTTQGKLDVRKLPKPSTVNHDIDQYELPQGPIEQRLSEMWSDLLGIEVIGVHDHFFTIGGQSLKAALLMNDIRNEFNVSLSVRDLFLMPTIRQLAIYISNGKKGDRDLIPVTDRQVREWPASRAQARMYLMQELNPDSTGYHITKALRIHGSLDPIRLKSSLQQLINRHESLRTSFHLNSGMVTQRIHDTVELSWKFEILNEIDFDTCHRQELRPFQLNKPGLIKAVLYGLAPDDHILWIDMHHIISDAMSVSILLGELQRDYVQGLSLDACHLQYRDYAVWHSQLLDSGQLDEQREFWLQEFNTLPEPLNLPLDFPRPSVLSGEGNTYTFEVDRDLTKNLKEVCNGNGATLYMLLLSAYAVLLANYTGQTDIVIGTPAAGRTHKDTQNIVGMFVNTLPIRVRPNMNDTFKQLLVNVKNTVIKALGAQDYPLDALVDQLGLRRDRSRNPLFDTAFVMQNVSVPTLLEEKVQMEDYPIVQYASMFDLSLECKETEERLVFVIEYSTEIFLNSTIQRMAIHFEQLLNVLSSNLTKQIKDIQMMEPNELTQLQSWSNGTSREISPSGIIERIQQYAHSAPTKVAIKSKNDSLTYEELNQLSRNISRKLFERNLGSESIIGVYMTRGPLQIATLLAVWRAGAAYLPIDPEYPVERIRFMLEDSKAALLLVDDEINFNTSGTPVWNVRMDREESVVDDLGALSVEKLPVSSDALAYIIYTSGTTGKPKGVMVEHKNVMAYITAFLEEFKLNTMDKVLQQASVAFDTYVEEVFPALSVGASLIIVEKDELLQPAQLRERMQNEKVSVISCSPLLLKEINHFNPISSLRLAISGGDVLKPEYIDQLIKYCKVYNTYGPSEATVCASYYEVQGGETRIPIGRPITNYSLYILDTHFRPVPIGVTGQICIGGAGVSKGYLGNRELTEGKFRNDLLPEETTLYISGDLGRWLPNGNVEYLGRSDQQVNIRGYRIETEEVERALLNHPSIVQTAVIAIQEEESFLCAYIVSESEWTIKELRSYLALQLPSYMIPSFFVKVERIPVTINGKIDVQRLPNPKELTQNQTTDLVSQNSTEQQLIEIWKDVLRIPIVSVDSDFFEVGGHSLKALELASRIQEQLHKRIETSAIFEYPRLNDLSDYILSLSPDESGKVAIQKLSKQHSYPLSSNQKRLYVIEQLEEPGTAYNMPAAFRIVGKTSIADLEKAWMKLLDRHEILRTSFEEVDGEPQMIVHDQLTNSSFTVIEGPQAIHDLIFPFDLARAPLCRMCVLKESENTLTIVIDMHHIVSDGLTVNLLFRDFEAFYRGEMLEPLELQYKEFAAWQNTEVILQSDQLSYWKKVLEGELPVLQFPYDFNKHSNTGLSESKLIEFHVESSIYLDVQQMASSLRVTPYMLLLAVYHVLLSKYTGQEDIIVGIPVLGRSRPEFDEVAGMFVNTLTNRSFPRRDLSFTDFLQDIKEAVTGAFENQDLPLDHAIDRLNEEGQASNINLKSLLTTMFSFREETEEDRTFADYPVEIVSVSSQISKFDFGIEIVDQSNHYTLELTYAKSLFRDETMEMFGRAYMTLLQSFLKDAEMKLSESAILTTKESLAQLKAFNPVSTRTELRPIYLDIEEQALRTPNDCAINYGGNSISYRELNGKANDLASKLQEMNICQGSHVPVLMDRSPELVISLLAIMKSGASFVPMDPNWPASRIESIIEDAKATVTLFDHHLGIPAIEFGDSMPIGVSIDQLALADNLEPSATPEDPIYIIYTSGSTGKPKGVVVPHRGISNRFAWMNDYFGSQAAASVLQTTHHVFDSSVWQFFWPLTVGGKTVLPDGEQLLSATYIASVIEDNQITLTDFVPSVFNVIVDQLLNGSKELLQKLESLQSVIIGGEEVAASTVHQFQKLLPDIQLTNLYGPTEASIGCIYHQIDGKETVRIPIGRPVHNTQILILDESLHLVPPGVIGEIYISGLCLADGYLNDTEKTKAVFIKHAYPEAGWGRMYKTGDLAKYDHTGNIEYMGRSDFQVKIRGLRIELGEIESQIMLTNQVKEAVVTTADSGGQSVLCAYVVPYGNLNIAELKRELQLVLPGYMIPAAFVSLQSMPLSPSGKVDRKALPTPDWSEHLTFVSTSNSLEEDIKQLWVDILGSDYFGVTDDFFMLGGHSLKLFALAAGIQERFGIRISLKDLYSLSTIRELARHIEERDQSEISHKETHFSAFPTDQEEIRVRASAQQNALYVLDRFDGIGLAYHMPSVYEWIGEFDEVRFNQAVQKLVDHHEALRTRFELEGSVLMQVIQKKQRIEISHYESTNESLEFWKETLISRFQLSDGPLFKIVTVKRGEVRYVLMDMHHIISDGQSMQIILRDLQSLYENQPIPGSPIQLRHFAEWQHMMLESEEGKAHEQFWRNMLGTDPKPLVLPTDYKRSEIQSFEGNMVFVDFGEDLSFKLHKFAEDKHYTVYMLMLAAYSVLLSMYSGERKLIIGTPVSGRTSSYFENTIGMFVNTLPFQLTIDMESTFVDYLKLVKEWVLEGLEHQDYPLEEIVRNLSLDRSADRSPLFNVLLAVEVAEETQLSELMRPASLPGWEDETVKFDLAITVKDHPDRMSAEIQYATNLYKSETITKMGKHLMEVITQMITDVQKPLSSIQLVQFDQSNQTKLESLKQELYEFDF
ncbi:amino acid adenylation domain-containing protein [Paenibacillus silvae]|uniref:amino acid adenylation domain-containing protein n=1 Tax=Paenibacillus silvae TaxID=1325358 RepID=UPI003CEED39D